MHVLTEKGAKSVKIDRQHAEDEEWFKERVWRNGNPLEIHGLIKLLKRMGNVKLYGSRLAAATFDVDESQFIPEANGIVEVLWIPEEKAIQADHCEYF